MNHQEITLIGNNVKVLFISIKMNNLVYENGKMIKIFVNIDKVLPQVNGNKSINQSINS